ncbi:MAG TPA: nucleotidyltransferase domain-containing protein [Mucilaginibacter sp.]|nr:nucleotidyltransferase domain-containing protein [Mucilaginibacter sp.]
MDSLAIYKTIRETVQSNLPDSRVVLFGSRAKGNHDHLSDYDLLVITSSNFTPQEKIQWSTRLDRAIIKAIKAPVDLLLSSEEEIKWQRELPGHIVRTALREGIAL